MTRYAPLLCLLAIVGLAGCRSIADQKWPIACEQPAHPASGVRVIQIDEGTSEEDPGEFFDATDLTVLRTWLESGQDAPIVVYVHGWHNNATEAKPNLPAFRSFMCELEADICDVATAKRGYRPACPGVQGVYVGWRGDSLDPVMLPDILDVGTFGGRRNASRRVGRGDLQEVIELVTGFPERDVFIAGHSLGANAIYYALKTSRSTAPRRNYFLLNPAITSEEFHDLERLLRLETRDHPSQRQQEPEEANRRIEEQKHRQVVVMQAQSDWVVRILFRMGYGRPIGFDKGRYTHEADAMPLEKCPKFGADQLEDENLCKVTFQSGLTIRKARDYEATCPDAFAKSVWIVTADSSVSSGHGDIWGTVQRCTLAELISKRVNRIPGY